MATIIDELLITLGLDSRKFKTEAEGAAAAIKKISSEAVKESKSLEDALKKHQAETTKRLQQVEQTGKSTFQQFNKLRLEVMALLSALATGYGIQEFIKNMTSSEASLGRLSKVIGNISTEDLAAFEQASERMGGNAEAAGQSIAGLSQQIERMKLTGEEQPFVAVFRQMHIGISNADKSARSFMDILNDIHKWMSTHTGPEAAAVGARLGFDPGTINLLRSPNYMQALEQVKRLGVTNEADAAKGQEFIENLHDLEQTLNRLGQTIANDFLPEINKVMISVTEWVTANKELIKSDIESWISKAITVVKDFWVELNKVVDAVGGWQHALEIVFALWAAEKILPIIAAISQITAAMAGLGVATAGVGTKLGMLPLLFRSAALASTLMLSGDTPGGGNPGNTVEGKELDDRIEKYNKEHPDNPIESFSGMMSRLWGGARRFFGVPSGATDTRMASVRDQLSQNLGITPTAASGIVSNLNAESGIAGINEVNPTVPGSRGGFGWAQWTGPRRDEFENYAAQHNLDPASDQANMGFLVQELTTKYPAVLAQLKRGGISAREAAEVVARGYIIPPSDKIEGHISDANRISGIKGGEDIISKPTMDFKTPPAAIDPSIWDSVKNPTIGSINHDNSRVATNSNETHIGQINIQTSATDSDGIARGVGNSLRKYAFVSFANTGLG